MATKKQEELINKLFASIKTNDLDKDLVTSINQKGFLYSVGRLNVLQIAAFLTHVAIYHCGYDLDTCIKLLGSTEKGNLYYEQ